MAVRPASPLLRRSTPRRGRWGISPNLADGTGKVAAAGGGGKGLASNALNGAPGGAPLGAPVHRIAALNLPERPQSQGEHWTISHDKGMNSLLKVLS